MLRLLLLVQTHTKGKKVIFSSENPFRATYSIKRFSRPLHIYKCEQCELPFRNRIWWWDDSWLCSPICDMIVFIYEHWLIVQLSPTLCSEARKASSGTAPLSRGLGLDSSGTSSISLFLFLLGGMGTGLGTIYTHRDRGKMLQFIPRKSKTLKYLSTQEVRSTITTKHVSISSPVFAHMQLV